MKGKKLFATLAISAMLLTGCTLGLNTIIKVNNQKITQADFDKLFNDEANNSMFSQMGMDIKNDKNNFLYLIVKEKVVNELIIRALLDQEMEKRKIVVTKEDTDKELKSIIDKIGSKEKFDEMLKQNKISSAKLKKDLVEEVKLKKLISTLYKGKVTDADAKKFYKENLSKFKYPDKVRASHILISANPEEIRQRITSDPTNKNLSKSDIQAMMDKEMKTKLEKAKKILAEVQKTPVNFGAIAIENSDDTTSAKQGGDLGFFAKQEMVEPFAKAAFNLKPNTISGIVQSPYGYHIILVKDRKKAGVEPFEKVKPEIISYLENQDQVKVIDNLVESLKNQAKIEFVNKEYNPIAIQEALKKSNNNPAGALGASPAPAPLPVKK